MKNKTILCVTLVLVTAIVCGTLLYLGNSFIDVFSAKNFSSSQSVQSTTLPEEQDFLTKYDVCQYLHIDEDTLNSMIAAGEFDGCYFRHGENGYTFIREKLYAWALEYAAR